MKAKDVAAAILLIAFSAFAIIGSGIEIRKTWSAAHGAPALILIIAAVLLIGFQALQILMLCLRRLPIAKAQGAKPRAWALTGVYGATAIFFLPKSEIVPAWQIASGLTMALGFVAAIISLWHLGRSFSIFPQARGLVTAGPYRFVRHPLYLSEQIAVMGLALSYDRPWSIFIALAAVAIQLPRMKYEEAVLQSTYPEYEAYARKTARLIPYVY